MKGHALGARGLGMEGWGEGEQHKREDGMPHGFWLCGLFIHSILSIYPLRL